MVAVEGVYRISIAPDNLLAGAEGMDVGDGELERVRIGARGIVVPLGCVIYRLDHISHGDLWLGIELGSPPI